jgi:hypothetical protein
MYRRRRDIIDDLRADQRAEDRAQFRKSVTNSMKNLTGESHRRGRIHTSETRRAKNANSKANISLPKITFGPPTKI